MDEFVRAMLGDKETQERMTVDHPERASFCLGCMNDTCKGTCKEFKDRFGRGAK